MPPGKLEGIKVLVVDDEEDLREILSEDFANAGATVFTAKNGREAFEIIKRETPEVVLSDVRMPGGDGVELLKQIRTLSQDPPPFVFLLTGFADIQAEETIALGGQGLVAKPFNLRQLRERVIQILGRE
ncbi:MAG: response regulator [Bdellovibrionaceae bacterium]|nr:response regulator [Pseudobdellovibrionaceae bacterium]